MHIHSRIATLAAIGAVTFAALGTAAGATGKSSHLRGKTPIVIGSMADITGLNASNVADVPQVVRAWQDMVNSSGGINGYPVKVDLLDTQSDPTVALRDAKKLILQDHVMAIAGSYGNEDSAVAPFVSKSGVPWIGGASYEAPATTNPDWFPTGADISAYEWGIGQAAQKKGEKKWGLLYCAEAPICSVLGSTFPSLVKVFGGSSVFSGEFSSTAPSYTSQCVALKQAGADAVYVVGPATAQSAIYTQCAQQGVTATEYLTGGISPTILANPAAAGAIDTLPDVPISDTATAGAKIFHAAIRKYAKAIIGNPEYTDTLMPVWAGLQMFRYAGNLGGLTPTSKPAKVKAALWKVKNVTLGGIAPPITYVKNKPTQVNCTFFEQIQNKKLVEPFGPRPECIPASEVATISKIFGG